MEIVKAFTTNKMHTEIVIKGTINDPLFRTSDIAEILELNNVRSSVKGFDDSEKVVHKTPTLGGLQEVSFLVCINYCSAQENQLHPSFKIGHVK